MGFVNCNYSYVLVCGNLKKVLLGAKQVKVAKCMVSIGFVVGSWEGPFFRPNYTSLSVDTFYQNEFTNSRLIPCIG